MTSNSPKKYQLKLSFCEYDDLDCNKVPEYQSVTARRTQRESFDIMKNVRITKDITAYPESVSCVK